MNKILILFKSVQKEKMKKFNSFVFKKLCLQRNSKSKLERRFILDLTENYSTDENKYFQIQEG